MTQREAYLTQEGLRRLEEELAHLRNIGRQEVAARIQRAKEIGGTVDNAEYDDAKNEQAFVEGRILTLETLIKNAVIIPDRGTAPAGRVGVGSRVSVANNATGKTERYTIVGSTETDPTQGRISNESPVGKALLGKAAGEEVEVRIPSGVTKLKILKIE